MDGSEEAINTYLSQNPSQEFVAFKIKFDSNKPMSIQEFSERFKADDSVITGNLNIIANFLVNYSNWLSSQDSA